MINRRGSISRRAALGLLGAACAPAQAPYKDRRSDRAPFEGPGREVPEPSELKEVALGFFGPSDPAHALGGTTWMGAQFAVDQANADGGFRGAPFRLVSRWADDPWRAGASAVVQLAYVDKVWAIIGGIDGATTHLAAQAVAKALLPLVDPVSTDETVNHANVPWVFSWAPGDTWVAGALFAMLTEQPFALVAGTDHDSRILAGELLKTAARHNRVPALRLDVSGSSVPSLAGSASQFVILCPPEATAAIVRQAPPSARLLCGPSAASRLFLKNAGSAAARVASVPLAPANEALLGRMHRHFQAAPDSNSLLSHAATLHLIAAIRKAGLNRALIRDELARDFGPLGRRAPETQPSISSTVGVHSSETIASRQEALI